MAFEDRPGFLPAQNENLCELSKKTINKYVMIGSGSEQMPSRSIHKFHLRGLAQSRRFYWVMGVLLFLSVAVFFAIAFLTPKEPVYAGKPISQWLQSIDLSPNPPKAEVQVALRALGPDALPVI